MTFITDSEGNIAYLTHPHSKYAYKARRITEFAPNGWIDKEGLWIESINKLGINPHPFPDISYASDREYELCAFQDNSAAVIRIDRTDVKEMFVNELPKLCEAAKRLGLEVVLYKMQETP